MKRSFLTFTLVWLVVGMAVAGGRGETTPITVEVMQRERAYLSPNGDGQADVLDVSSRFTIDRGTGPELQRAVKVLEATVFGTEGDLAGEAVWQRREVETGRRSGLQNLFNVGDEPGVAVPEELSWDGTFLESGVGEDGEVVPDGDYIFQLSLVDELGELVSTPPLNVTVDTVDPVIADIDLNTTIFSPNDDGVRDSVTIRHSLSQEQRWTGEIVADTDGSVVRAFVFQNDGSRTADVAPSSVEWDGLTDAGELAPEGVYQYRVTGTDRAGNTASQTAGPLSLSLAGGEVQVAVSPAVFSPNEDGVLDTIDLLLQVGEPEGIVQWTIAVARADQPDSPEWSLQDTGTPPSVVPFSGRTTGGISMPDGAYAAQFAVEYNNGTQVAAEPVSFTIDTTPPDGRLVAETAPVETDLSAGVPLAFGGPQKTHLEIYGSLSDETEWVGMLESPDRSVMLPIADLRLSPPEVRVSWDGRFPDGTPAPDGRYELYLTATDEAGNTGRTNSVIAIKDTRPVSVDITPRTLFVSPNSDGAMESIVFDIEYVDNGLIDDFLLSIKDSVGRVMRSQYHNQPFSVFEWFGRSNGNSILPDGTYSAELEVIYFNGARASAEVGGLRIDTAPPSVNRFSVPYTLFSPDGDGERDTLPVTQRTSTENEWYGRIVQADAEEDGAAVFTLTWRGQASDFVWDGTNERGVVVPDGDYTYVLTSTDQAGNRTSFRRAIVVDTREVEEPAPETEPQEPVVATTARPAAAMTVFPVPFTPDGDGTNDMLTISMIAEATVGISGWELEILGPDGGLVERFEGDGSPPRTITWDGTAGDGELVQSAQDYAALLTVVDENDAEARADALIPVGILVIRDGENYRIMVPDINFAPFSANLFDVGPEDLQENLRTLRDIARVLKRFPEYTITVEGHAVHQVFDPVGKDLEQQEELVPLSTARAEEVRQALTILGVDYTRMDIVGYGGARPIVPHEDFERQWRNRRVEFLLQQE